MLKHNCTQNCFLKGSGRIDNGPGKQKENIFVLESGRKKHASMNFPE
jgi:hypothetical protein